MNPKLCFFKTSRSLKTSHVTDIASDAVFAVLDMHSYIGMHRLWFRMLEKKLFKIVQCQIVGFHARSSVPSNSRTEGQRPQCPWCAQGSQTKNPLSSQAIGFSNVL